MILGGTTAPCYWLPEHVYTCSTDDGVIFLDTRNNRYRGLRPHEAEALRRLVHNWPPPLTPHAGADTLENDDVRELIAALIRSELISSTPQSDGRPSRLELPVARPLQAIGFGTEFDYSIATKTVFAFLEAYAGALIDLRLRSLRTVVRRIRRVRLASEAHAANADLERVTALVSSFRRIRHYFFTGDGKCLLHALTLMRYLAFYNVFPLFVIGVRTSPWSAHSWVELNGCTLDATPEKVRPFTPILVE